MLHIGSKNFISTVILDIEGTTTPISFVADNLFPYIRKNLTDYLKNEWKSDELQEDISALRQLAIEDQQSGVSECHTDPTN